MYTVKLGSGFRSGGNELVWKCFGFGQFQVEHLMNPVMAHARRLGKYGA